MQNKAHNKKIKRTQKAAPLILPFGQKIGGDDWGN